MKKISYIFPVYNEGGNLSLLYKRISNIVEALKGRYEIELIFINDGSKDDSIERLWKLQEKDNRVVVIDFSKNFGHQMAVTAGLDYSSGDAVIIMDSDLQDPPEVSLELIEAWEKGYEVVYAQRKTRQDTFFKKATASLFYRMLAKVADIEIPRNTGDFRLLDRKVVLELSKFRERNRFIRGMVSYVGFKQVAVLFDRDKRHSGKTGYPLGKMLKFAADGIFGFSSAPLKLISRLGYTIAFLSTLGILYVLFVRIFTPQQAVEGWAFTVVSIFFVGGIQLIMLGVLGSYIGRIYSEVQGRPLYSVSSIKQSVKNEKKPKNTTSR